MNFIETLASLGGVKPCWQCSAPQPPPPGKRVTVVCACHGTGQVLDLAPLLADTGELTDVAHALLNSAGFTSGNCPKCRDVWSKPKEHVTVVGPQRAHSLVYEIARQLGGTAVVAHVRSTSRAIMMAAERGDMIGEEDMKVMLELERQGAPFTHFLSLPIPPDATVLFVTDRFSMQEILEIRKAVWTEIKGGPKSLPYVLALVSDCDKHLEPNNETYLNVISLHQEHS